MIAYKDAIRHHVCLGDKVLAPWQPDGRYGPGTVLDGIDRRDPQPTGKLEEGYKMKGLNQIVLLNENIFTEYDFKGFQDQWEGS